MASYSSEEMLEALMAMTKENIKPEPQYSTIVRYLANHFDKEFDKKSALVYLTNSHGVQLRNDIKYWKDRREKSSEDDAEKLGPVLNCSDLSIFENYDDLMKKVKELPDEWTVIQITKQYSPLDVLGYVKDQSDNGIYLTKFSCGKLAERIPPYYVTIKSRNQQDENFMECFRCLLKIRNDYFTSGGVSRKVKLEYASTECGLAKLLVELENHWLRGWRCLLGGRLEDRNLESETYLQVRKSLDNFQKRNQKMKKYSEESLNIVYQLTLSIHLMKNLEIKTVLNYVLYGDNVNKDDNLVPLIEELKEINSGNSGAVKKAKKLPVILIIDKPFEIIPWEMLCLLSGQPVTRILSLHLLYGLYKYHETHVVGGYRILKIDSGFCVINPTKDLNECEKEITQFLKMNMPWIESEVGRAPDSKLLAFKFEDSDVFLYCGHGSGRQYMKAKNIKKTFVKGLVLLYGCSSNIPKTAGGRTPYHNDTYTYITNGSPCQIGCIYDITSTDADSACKEMLQNFLPTSTESGEMKMPKEPDVLKGVVAGKSVCKKYWSQCSFVARGLPCKTEAGDISLRRECS